MFIQYKVSNNNISFSNEQTISFIQHESNKVKRINFSICFKSYVGDYTTRHVTCAEWQHLTVIDRVLSDICPPVLCPNIGPSIDETDGKLPGTDGRWQHEQT